jgi:hypothetical protein
MAEFRRAWAVVGRDLTPVEGQDADTVTVLKVFFSQRDAQTEVRRLRNADPSDERFYYCEATEVETA